MYIYLQDKLIVAPSIDGSEMMSWLVYMICIILGKASSEKFREFHRGTSVSLALKIRSLLFNYELTGKSNNKRDQIEVSLNVVFRI